jgi:epoxide hydrolase-like predicted phosphatase
MTIKTIIWDVGGVLVRTEDPAPRAALAADLDLTAQEISYALFDSPSGRAAQMGEISAAENLANLGQELNLDAAGIEDFRKRFFAGDQLDQLLITQIKRYGERYQNAILSNMGDNLRPHLERVWKIADGFGPIIISAEVQVMKPAARIFEITLERCGVAADEAVFLDDFPENIAAARAVGLNAIHFRSREQALSDLDQLLGQTA